MRPKNQTEYQTIFSLALHLSGHFYQEQYQAETNIKKLSHMLLAKDFSSRIEVAQKVYEEQQRKGIQVISFFEENYPELLKKIHSPPFILFCLGKLSILNKNKVSIVGTRKPSMVGLKVAEFIANHLSERDIVVVSGMAHGIDTACHRSSYQNAGGTIGVLAHGLDYIYPRSNYDLYQEVQENDNTNLLFISEYPAGTKPRRFHFPRRNRIISALSGSLFFIEGGRKSGALITCRYALDQGREVYAFDHPLLTNNEGGKELIFEGASQLSSYYHLHIEDQISSANLLDQIHKKNSFYLGNHLWVSLESKQDSPNVFISFAA